MGRQFLRFTPVSMQAPKVYLMTAWEAESLKYAMICRPDSTPRLDVFV